MMSASDRPAAHSAIKEIRRQELLRLLILGYSLKDAAVEMKMGYFAVRTTARDPMFILAVRERSEEIARRLGEELVTNQFEMAQKLEEASGKALEAMIEMMDSMEGPSKLKKEICADLLDRDPKSSRSKRLDVTGAVGHQFINPAVLIHAAATAKELERFQLGAPGGNGSTIDSADSGNGQG
jgi:hypothetical protein